MKASQEVILNTLSNSLMFIPKVDFHERNIQKSVLTKIEVFPGVEVLGPDFFGYFLSFDEDALLNAWIHDAWLVHVDRTVR